MRGAGSRTCGEGLPVVRLRRCRWDRRLGAVSGRGAGYELGCRLTLGEVNAAIEGAVAGGPTDGRQRLTTMRNLDPDEAVRPRGLRRLGSTQAAVHDGGDSTTARRHLPDRLPRLDLRPSSTLSHTYNPEVFCAARINGAEVGRAASTPSSPDHFGVPIGLVTGDAVTQETSPFAGRRRRWSPSARSPGSPRQPAPGGGPQADPGAAEQCVRWAAGTRPPGLDRPRVELDLTCSPPTWPRWAAGSRAPSATAPNDPHRVGRRPRQPSVPSSPSTTSPAKPEAADRHQGRARLTTKVAQIASTTAVRSPPASPVLTTPGRLQEQESLHLMVRAGQCSTPRGTT